MKKVFVAKAVVLMMLLSLIIPFVYSNLARSESSLSAPGNEGDGRIIYVDDDNVDGPWDGSLEHPYKDIRQAIENATDGDTIFVFNGEYRRFTVKKRLNIFGEDNENTIIKIGQYEDGVILKADWINFSNFKLIGEYKGLLEGVIEVRKNHITVSDCNIVSGDVGVTIDGEYWYTGDYFNSNCTVSNCTFRDLLVGVFLLESHHCLVENCTFYDDVGGAIYILHLGGRHVKRYNHIINCKILGAEVGVCTKCASCNYISNCEIYGSSKSFAGVWIKYGDYNVVTSCLITNFTNGSGCRLDGWSLDNAVGNKILGNNFSHNRKGVYCCEYSYDNYFHHNNFIGNLKYNAIDYGKNFWDDGKEGNYWDDYNGSDLNGDGIGDTPYFIGNNSDNCPLMEPWNMNDKPPNKPSIDAEPEGLQWVEYSIPAEATDPNFDSLFYFFDWGDGTTSGWVGPFPHGEKGRAKHRWKEPGIYRIRVKVKDITGLETGWSTPFEINILPNNRPEKPILDGPSEGIVGYPVNFSVTSTDADGDKIRYYFDWGWAVENHNFEWTDYYNSSEEVEISHVWGDKYNKIPDEKAFIIKVKAQDIHGADSEWTFVPITIKNNPPSPAIIVDAPTEGVVEEDIYINVTATDPDGHYIIYYVKWGDGCEQGFGGKSGEIVTLEHTYFHPKDHYTIKITTFDRYNARDGSVYYNITIRKKSEKYLSELSKLIRTLYNKLIEKMMNIIKSILERLGWISSTTLFY